MEFLRQLFENGAIVLIAMSVLAIEIACIIWLRPRGIFAGPIIANGVSGIGLLGALGAALTDRSFLLIGAFLTPGLIGHLVDLGLRFAAGRLQEKQR